MSQTGGTHRHPSVNDKTETFNSQQSFHWEKKKSQEYKIDLKIMAARGERVGRVALKA